MAVTREEQGVRFPQATKHNHAVVLYIINVNWEHSCFRCNANPGRRGRVLLLTYTTSLAACLPCQLCTRFMPRPGAVATRSLVTVATGGDVQAQGKLRRVGIAARG
jgi:hypothetical protein